MLKLQQITVNDYTSERENIHKLVDTIWADELSSKQAKHSIDRWGNSGTESGQYFYIFLDDEVIGITGFFIPSLEKGIFGLRHHGVTKKGNGRIALNLLVEWLVENYGGKFEYLIELIPEGHEELIKKFEEWGFKLSAEPVPEWEPKKDYYKYVMIRES